jgi:hypothetical protein
MVEAIAILSLSSYNDLVVGRSTFTSSPQPPWFTPPSDFQQFAIKARFPLHDVTAGATKFIDLAVFVM